MLDRSEANPHSQTFELFLKFLKRTNKGMVNAHDPEIIQEQNDLKFFNFIARFNEDLLFRLNYLRDFHLLEIFFGDKKNRGKLKHHYRELAEEFEAVRQRQLLSASLLNVVKKHTDLYQSKKMDEHIVWESFSKDLSTLLRERNYNHQLQLEFERKLYIHHKTYTGIVQKTYKDPRHTAFVEQIQRVFPEGLPDRPANAANVYNEVSTLFNENEQLSEEQARVAAGQLYALTEDNKAFQAEIGEKDYLLKDGRRDWTAIARDKEEITSRRNWVKELFERFISIPEAKQSQIQKTLQAVFKDRLALEKEIDAELEQLEAEAQISLKKEKDALVMGSMREIEGHGKSVNVLLRSLKEIDSSVLNRQQIDNWQQQLEEAQKACSKETDSQALADNLRNYLTTLNQVIQKAEGLPEAKIKDPDSLEGKAILHLKQSKLLVEQNLQDLQERDVAFSSVMAAVGKNENDLI